MSSLGMIEQLRGTGQRSALPGGNDIFCGVQIVAPYLSGFSLLACTLKRAS